MIIGNLNTNSGENPIPFDRYDPRLHLEYTRDRYLFLGKPLTLFEDRSQNRSSVRLEGRDLIITFPRLVNHRTIVNVIKKIECLYRDEAKTIIENILASLHPDGIISYLNSIQNDSTVVMRKDLRVNVRRMRRNIALCNCCEWNPYMTFHTNILSAPLQVIKSLVIHELIHFVHATHSEDYWNLVNLVDKKNAISDAWLAVNWSKLESIMSMSSQTERLTDLLFYKLR